MQNPTTYIDACNNFDKIYEEALLTRKPVVVTREGAESVAVIALAELNSIIIETAYLFQSPENASRLIAAIERAKTRTFKPRTVEDLDREFGCNDE